MAELELIPILGINWESVKVPLVICLWILLAGIAKIGFHHANKYQPRISFLRKKNRYRKNCKIVKKMKKEKKN